MDSALEWLPSLPCMFLFFVGNSALIDDRNEWNNTTREDRRAHRQWDFNGWFFATYMRAVQDVKSNLELIKSETTKAIISMAFPPSCSFPKEYRAHGLYLNLRQHWPYSTIPPGNWRFRGVIIHYCGEISGNLNKLTIVCCGIKLRDPIYWRTDVADF